MLRSLQAGRAIAALMVLGFHLGPTVQHYFGYAPFFLPFGHAGVDFFFVLSGFIITAAHRGDVGRPGRLGWFLWRRFVRIYPVYWLVFIAAFAGSYRIVHVTPAGFMNAFLLTPTGVAPVLAVAWSLQWEVIFYLLFGALIVHPALAVAGLAAILSSRLPEAQTYLGLFMAGAGCALIVDRCRWLPGRSLALVGLAIFAAACVQDVLSGVKPTLWLGVGSAVAVTGLVCAERAGHVWGGQPWLQRLGDASYSLYLIHYPLISAGCKLAVAFGLVGAAWGALVFGVLLVAAPMAAVALHFGVEKPMISRLNRCWQPALR